jgi:glycosyltransferase involved in cell wall biosynthesis
MAGSTNVLTTAATATDLATVATLPAFLRKASREVSVSVIIPALNEAENLALMLPSVPSWVAEVILVDGNSTDGTIAVAKAIRPDIRVVQEDGRGKGCALRTGFAAATGDIIVMLDADVSMEPAELPLYVGALLSGADFVKGSRFLQGGGTSDMPLHRKLGNKAFVWMVRLFFGGNYSDLCYGYAAFWRDVLPELDLHGDGFEIETVMNIRALKAGLRISEVPSFEDKRAYGEGRLRTFPDGMRVLKAILSERFRPSTWRKPSLRTERLRGNVNALASRLLQDHQINLPTRPASLMGPQALDRP